MILSEDTVKLTTSLAGEFHPLTNTNGYLYFRMTAVFRSAAAGAEPCHYFYCGTRRVSEVLHAVLANCQASAMSEPKLWTSKGLLASPRISTSWEVPV